MILTIPGIIWLVLSLVMMKTNIQEGNKIGTGVWWQPSVIMLIGITFIITGIHIKVVHP